MKKNIAKKSTEDKAVKVARATTPQTLRGFKDILPEDQKFWQYINKTSESLLLSYGFDPIETPILEETSLFVRGIGTGTDVVDKEMFSFVDQGGQKMSLRPEATASVARAYIEHGMLNLPQPVKLFYWGPMFRHERPQAGRYRQFHQLGIELLGDANPVVDAEAILAGYSLMSELGVECTIQVNSIGCTECRKQYRKLLLEHFRPYKKSLCADCSVRYEKNPLRLLDCKEKNCQEIAQEAPQLIDHLCEECRNHFMRVVGYLDELDISYVLNPKIVRGLDYYNRTVFEFWPIDDTFGQSALLSGGRYDGLVELLGGRATPAIGWAMGVERIAGKLRENKIIIPPIYQAQVYVAQLGDVARKKSLRLFEELRKAGFKVLGNFSKDSLKTQLELANRSKVKLTLILGQKEVNDGTILIRDMESGIQETIPLDKVQKELQRRLVNS